MKIKFIQKIIDKLRNKAEGCEYIPQLANKILAFENCINEIDTLIIGSSHAQHGYRAESNEFNLGLAFQDLYYSWELYNKYHNHKFKKIILFYSVFSPGNQVIKTKFANKAAAYKVVANIDYQDKISAKEKNLKKFERPYKYQFKKFKDSYIYIKGYRGNETIYSDDYKTHDVKERTIPHYKNNIRKNNQTEYVVKINNLAKENGAKLIVVIPPATKEYKNNLPASSELFSELFKIAEQYKIPVVNMYDSESYTDNDFTDWDHLSLDGANKLTKELKAIIG